MTDIGDALSQAIVARNPGLAGKVHLVNGRPWCDGVNHTTMCDPRFIAEEAKMPEPVTKYTWPLPWEQWFTIQTNLEQEIDERIDKAANGRSDQFKAALISGLIEHLGERLRFYLHLPESDGRENGNG